MRKYWIVLQIILIVFIFLSCQDTSRVDIPGVYYCTNDYDATSTMILKQDGTFTFKTKTGFSFDEDNGYWKIKGERLFLKTSKFHSSYKVVESDSGKSNYLTVYDAQTKEIICSYFEAYAYLKLIDEDISDSLTSFPKAINFVKVSNDLFHYDDISIRLNIHKSYNISVYLAKEKNYELLENKIRIFKDTIVFFNGLQLIKIDK